MAYTLSEKLKLGRNIYGTCIVSPSPIWSKAVKGVGLDFVFIDTEHIPMDRTELTFLCQVYEAQGIAPLVRIPSPDPYLACMAKDAGAVGVVAPYVEEVQQVKELVGATKYRPLKGKRLARALEGKEVLEPELQQYLNGYNKGSLCLINIESKVALENLDALLDVPGLDGVIIGPHDLSINLGMPEQYDHPDFERTVKEIIKKARDKDLAAGIHFPTGPERQITWMREGANVVLHSSDMFLFVEKLKEDLGKIKQASGESMDEVEDSGLAI